MIVDTHAHVLSADTVRYPVDPVGGVQSEWSKGFRFGSDEMLAAMDDAGVDAATVVQASTVYGNDNRLVAESVAPFPERLAGVGGIDPRMPDAIGRLRREVADGRLRGMRVFAGGSTIASSDWLDAADLDPFWSAVTDLGIPLNLQIRFADIGRLDAIARRHPRMTMIVDNLAVAPLRGGPPYAAAEALFELARYPQLAFKLTNSNIAAGDDGGDARDLLVTLAARFGADRLMWGSNFPTARPSGESPYRRMVERARQAVERCSVPDRVAILGGTAARLYGFATAR